MEPQYFITDGRLLWFSVACFRCQRVNIILVNNNNNNRLYFKRVTQLAITNLQCVRFRLLSGQLLGNSCSLG